MDGHPDYRRAGLAAARVLRDNGVAYPPVLPRQLAESLGLEVRYVTFKQSAREICGFIDFGENAIYVNADHSTNRQTFTIAHELGHHVLHRDLYQENPNAYKVLLRHPLKRERDPREKEANAFAADLLVPLEMLRKYQRVADVSQLAKLFGVSEDVIGFRRGIVSSER